MVYDTVPLVNLTNPHRTSVLLRTLLNFNQTVNTLCYLLQAGFLLGLFSDTEDGVAMFLRNVGLKSTGYTAP
jgi:hypothetical protein